MESQHTTEELFATLDPVAREEAIRLAARLQAGDEESVKLVAAAKEAGIDDRFLREAAEQISAGRLPGGRALREPPAPTAEPSLLMGWPRLRWTESIGFVPSSVLLLFLLAQAHAGQMAHYSASYRTPFVAYFLATALAFVLPRTWSRRMPMAIVAGVWAVNLAVSHMLTLGLSFQVPLHSSQAVGLQFAFFSLVSAMLGVLLSGIVLRFDKPLKWPSPSSTP